MEQSWKMGILYALCLYFIRFHLVSSFNLDTNAPIIKIGNTDSYFGFSVAQHIITEERYSPDGLTQLPSILHHVLLVGAPKDNVTVPSSPSIVRQTVRPGAVHQCAFSSFKDDCDQLELMITEPQTDLRGNPEEDRTDQWLGVSVASTGTPQGKALACAHRYKKIAYKNQREVSAIWGPGLCVIMGNTLDQDNFYDVCGSLSTDRGHQDYGFCQAGISASASKENDVLMGAAGVYTWRGMVAKNKFFMKLGDDQTMFLSHHDDYDPIRQPIHPDTEYFSYLGMATAIGRLIMNETTYVAGAPRSNETGQVLLYKQGDSSLDKQIVLTGDQFGSYFGYSLAVMDLNSDGLQDLVVGAPYYYEDGIGGAIYVYVSGPQGITNATKHIKVPSRKMSQTECKELNCANARFGFSLSALGDVDQDGYQDLAVGAPFEGDGVVYIFRGSEDGINTEYSQRIEAEDMVTARPLTTFGYSLSGGIDVDSNTYPDLAVGAYKSDKVLLLRARPVVNVTVKITSTPEEIDPKQEERCPQTGRDMMCFTLHVCFMFTAKPENDFSGRVTLDYSIEAETFIEGTPSSRVMFKGGDPSNRHIISRSSTLHPQSENRCKNEPHEVYIQKGNRDFLKPISFQLKYKLQDKPPPIMNVGDPVPAMNMYPVLNNKKASIIHAVDFKKNCGDDKRCQSDLQLSAEFLLTSDGDDRYILRLGEDLEPTLNITVRNAREDAHDASLNLTLPENFRYLGINDESQKYSCIPDKSQLFVICSLGNPMGSGEVASFQIRLNPDDLTPMSSALTVGLKVSTTSDETHAEDNSQVFSIKVVVQTDIRIIGSSVPQYAYFSGQVVGESAIRYEDQIGSQVIHNYEVKNVGKGSVSNCSVKVHWPYELQNTREQGKHLLYLIEAPAIEAPGQCFIEDRLVNPLKIKLDEEKMLKNQVKENPESKEVPKNTSEIQASERKSRVKRDEASAISADGKKIATLDCDQGTAKCFTFRCVIGQLSAGDSVVISIRSRLWNSTFLEEFVEYSKVNVQSKAEISIPESLNVQQLNINNDMDKALTVVIPGIEVKPPEQVPLWIIIVAVLAGVILLAVIIVLLWKCGFFQRKKADDMQMQKHKAKVEKQKHTHKYKKTYINYD